MAIKPCKECGQEVSSDAKKCPKCGKDQRNWFMQHKIMTAILVIIVLSVFASMGDDNSNTSPTSSSNTVSTSSSESTATTQQETKVAPTVITVDEIVKVLDSNALNASNTYKGKYVELTGKLSNIDSSGDYFSLAPMYDDYSFDTVMCYITQEHLDTVANFTDGQQVTVIGTITDVGEVMGYSLDVETIK